MKGGPFASFRFDGKRALVVGGATGMGAAAVELLLDGGAEVVVLDRSPIENERVKYVHLDLAERTSIEGALAGCSKPFDALLSCAGVADGTPGIERINFLGHRHLIELAASTGLLTRGSAIGLISSAAGAGWQACLPMLNEYLDIEDFDDAVAWAHANGKADYWWSKQSVNAYVAREALGFLKRGIRINAILPGPTDTPLAQANAELWLGFGSDYREEAGIPASTALDQAYPLVFLCSDAARAITGLTMVTDAGYFAAGTSGSFPAATPMVNLLLGRS